MKLKKWDDLSLLPSRIGPIPASFPLSLPVCVCVCLTVSLSVLLLLSLPPSVVHKLRILLRRCTPTTLYSSYQTGEYEGVKSWPENASGGRSMSLFSSGLTDEKKTFCYSFLFYLRKSPCGPP